MGFNENVKNKHFISNRSSINFNALKFDQYFLHGLENRENLLEGIAYYTNKKINERYSEDSRHGNKIPTGEERIEILKEELISIYEQLYRFLYMLDGKEDRMKYHLKSEQEKQKVEDSRFDYHLRPEEKEEVVQMAENTISQLRRDDMFMFCKAGMFIYDKPIGKMRNKGQEDDEEEKRVLNLSEYKWIKEIYEIIQKLQFMEQVDKCQYYKRWLQAKIGRLKEDNKKSKQYPESKISKLEEIYETFFNNNFEQRIEQKEGREL